MTAAKGAVGEVAMVARIALARKRLAASKTRWQALWKLF
jgi:hypothetical protein